MKKKYNLTSIFYLLGTTFLLFSFNSCGYKADPYYLKDAPQGDENVEFHLKQSSEKIK